MGGWLEFLLEKVFHHKNSSKSNPKELGKNRIQYRRNWHHRKYRNSYDLYVDGLLRENIKLLIKLGRYDATNRRDPYGRTDGEYAIAQSLAKLGIRYVPEYVLNGLNEDTAKYRVADFYLPREKIVIEFFGNWRTSEADKKRYKEKLEVYKKNGINCIPIYPEELYNITWILKNKLPR
jgi:hypothetical protein